MKKALLIFMMSVAAVVIGCDSESTTIMEGGENGGQSAIGGQGNGGAQGVTGGSSNQSVAGNSQVSGGNSSTQTTQTTGGTSSLTTTQCTPKTCQDAVSSIVQASNAVDATGQLINWSNVSYTACGDMSDGCGNVINCGACNTCGAVSGLGTYAPTKGVVGVCGETMCLYMDDPTNRTCVGANAGKAAWYCVAGNAVGPRTESNCSSIANPNPNSSLTYFCCDK